MLIEDGGKCRTQGELIAGSRTSSHQLNGYDLSLPPNPHQPPWGAAARATWFTRPLTAHRGPHPRLSSGHVMFLMSAFACQSPEVMNINFDFLWALLLEWWTCTTALYYICFVLRWRYQVQRRKIEIAACYIHLPPTHSNTYGPRLMVPWEQLSLISSAVNHVQKVHIFPTFWIFLNPYVALNSHSVR